MNDYGTGDQYPDEMGDRGAWFEAARARVKAPGTFLQLFGAFLVAVYSMIGVLSVVSPETIVNPQYDWIEKMQKDQPAEQRQKLPPRAEAIESQKIQGPTYAVIWVAAGILMFVGGSKMKELKGYGWAMAGSILAIFPGLCCCCIGLIPGIWSLSVLMNSDVKLAFSRSAGMGTE